MFWIILGAGFLFFAFNGHNITKNYIVTKYRKFRKVNKLVETKYKTIGMILWVSISMIAKMYWLEFLQWANTSINYKNKSVIISYTVNGKLYKIETKIKKGPDSVLLVMDENLEDITDEITPFLGINEDWHQNSFTPSFWNRKSLTFELDSGQHKTFLENEIINLL